MQAIENFFGFILPGFQYNGKISAKTLNNQQYSEVFNRIVNVALSRFTWYGLPETCNPEALEMTLLFYGRALFFKDDTLGFMHTPVELPGPYNVYYESIKRYAQSFDYHKLYMIDNSVVIRANIPMFPDYLTIWNYTPKIANALRAIDVQLETLKRPFLIRCPEKARNSVKAMIEKISDNEIAVVGEKIGDNGVFEVIPLVTQSNLVDMWATVKNYFNQVYSSLGVKNSFKEKRERMITSEVEGEEMTIRHTLESELSARRRAADQINAMFGLSIEVEANEIEVFADEFIKMQAAKVTGMRSEENVSES